MSLAPNSIGITPGAGKNVATVTIGGVDYQVFVLAGPDGQMIGSNHLYRLTVPSQAVGANRVYWDLFNATGSGITLRVVSCKPIADNSVAVTGTLGVLLSLTRTTAVGTGGTAATAEGTSLTAATISEFNLAAPALPAGVTARSAPTGGATAGALLGTRSLFTEETNAATAIAGLGLVDLVRDIGAPIYVPENTGLRGVQGAVASVGNIAWEITFEAV